MRWLVFLLAYVSALTVCFALFFMQISMIKKMCVHCVYMYMHLPLCNTAAAFIILAFVKLLTWRGRGALFRCARFNLGLPGPRLICRSTFDFCSAELLSFLCFWVVFVCSLCFFFVPILSKVLVVNLNSFTPACEIELNVGGRWVADESVADEATQAG